jgi:SagB-type dehydrogenase family enzyme
MKKYIIYFVFLVSTQILSAQSPSTITLNTPDTIRGLSMMKALSIRASVRNFDTTSLKLQDLSDLLWAANGVNRPGEGKRTAPSAQNAQDVDVYVFLKSGTYLYNASKHILNLVAEGDNRNLFPGRSSEDAAVPPVVCLLVSDVSKFKFGEDSLRLVWAAEDAGIVSQNISLFCASVGLVTRPKAGMNQQELRNFLKLKPSQHLMLNHPVSYKKE